MREYWSTRPKTSNHNPAWRTPDQLWDEAVKYFEWAHATPLLEEKVLVAGGVVEHVDLKRTRAFTIKGLCAFLGVRPSTFDVYAAKPKFAPVVESILTVIQTQKFEGAAAGLLNASIVARDLGLADRAEVTGKDGGPIQSEDVTKRDADEFARRMLRLSTAGDTAAGAVEPEPSDEG